MLPPDDHEARLDAAVANLRERLGDPPRLAVVLGSGLGPVADALENARAIPYAEIPHWPGSTVAGHAGRLVVGDIGGVRAAVLQGRAHLYEGYAPWQVVFPTRVLALLGVRSLVLTNAAGAVNTDFRPGDLMLISDHLNLQGSNPCAGPNIERLGERFFDLTNAYDAEHRAVARRLAAARELTLHEGVYAGLLGPSFETPAEIRMFGRLGADAVGMSTVPECIAANQAGVRVLGISCITNMAAGLAEGEIDHEEVLEIGVRVRDDLVGFLAALLGELAQESDDAR